MSTYGSSVINKSGKKLAPKAPPQRKHTATSPASPHIAPNLHRVSVSEELQAQSSVQSFYDGSIAQPLLHSELSCRNGTCQTVPGSEAHVHKVLDSVVRPARQSTVSDSNLSLAEPLAKRRKLDISLNDHFSESISLPALPFENSLRLLVPRPSAVIQATGDLPPIISVVPTVIQKTSELDSIHVASSPPYNNSTKHGSTRLAGTVPGLAVGREETSEATLVSDGPPQDQPFSTRQIGNTGLVRVWNQMSTARSTSTGTTESAESMRLQPQVAERDDQFGDSKLGEGPAVAGRLISEPLPINLTRVGEIETIGPGKDTQNDNAAYETVARPVSMGGSGTMVSSRENENRLARPRKEAQGVRRPTIMTHEGPQDATPMTTSQITGEQPRRATEKGSNEGKTTLTKRARTAKTGALRNNVAKKNAIGTGTPTIVSGRPTRLTRIEVEPQMNVDAPSSEAEEQDATFQTTTKRRQTTNNDASYLDRDDGTPVDDEREFHSTKRKGVRRREPTPDEAEGHEIDPRTVTLEELCKDTRNGKKSKLETAFQGIDWSEVARRKKEADARPAVRTLDPDETVDGRLDGAAGQPTTTHGGPQLKLVHGQMVIDDSSLIVDRHAEAAANQGNLPEELEETDLTTHITSQSWIYDNRREPEDRRASSHKSKSWDEDATDAFYDALRMFGTDFFIISKMFPGRTRRHIKLKFVREERANPDRVKRALIGENKPMDLGTYCEATGQEEDFFKDPEVLQAELREQDIRQTAEMEKEREEQKERAKSKQEAAFARSAASGKSVKTPCWKNKKKNQNPSKKTTGGTVLHAEAQATEVQAHAGSEQTELRVVQRLKAVTLRQVRRCRLLKPALKA